MSSWSANEFDVIGLAPNGSYLHKTWTGSSYYPSFSGWTVFEGNFRSAPAVVSWGPNRLDIFGISAEDGAIKHKYWNGDIWVPQGSVWEDLGGGPFRGDPVATSWGVGRFDVWAVDDSGELNHKYWDGAAYQGWNKMGGNFTNAPTVVHGNADKIDIVGVFDGGDDRQLHAKSWDGASWSPSFDGWFDKGGSFGAQPAVVVNKGTSKSSCCTYAAHAKRVWKRLLIIAYLDFLYILAVDDDGQLKLQIWDGWNWQPSYDEYWNLGDAQKPYGSLERFTVQELK